MTDMKPQNKQAKFVQSIIPACITFGPLFMVQHQHSDWIGASYLAYAGCLMLMVGLVVLFRMCMRMKREIEELKSDQQSSQPTQ